MDRERDNALAALARGDPGAVPRLARDDPEAVCRRAEHHGLLPLVADRLAEDPDVPARLQRHLRAHATRHAAADLVVDAEIRTVLASLEHAGVRPLLFKGAQLAYSAYTRPDLRPRLDTDLLIPPRARGAADEALRALGYDVPEHSHGELLAHQRAYVKPRDGRVVHVVDLHWRVANPQVFAGLPGYDDLAGAAVLIPQLGAGGRALAAPDALLLACVHRVAHHDDAERMIWLYDIHLLAGSLEEAGWGRFLAAVHQYRVEAVCRRSLERAVRCFGTVVPSGLDDEGQLHPAAEGEPSVVYLQPGRRHVHIVLSDLRALPGWRDRLQLVREHLFPSPRYMRSIYAGSSRVPLPFLYASRALRGARRWLDRSPR